MHFNEARTIIVPFKAYKNQTLEEVSKTDAGLLYLTWIRGRSFVTGTFMIALEIFLDDWMIRKEIERVMREQRKR